MNAKSWEEIGGKIRALDFAENFDLVVALPMAALYRLH